MLTDYAEEIHRFSNRFFFKGKHHKGAGKV